MTTFSAQVKQWSDKTLRNADLIKKAAAQTTFEKMSERQPSVKETGGAFEVGKLAVDTGALVNSQIAFVNDAAVAHGDVSYSAVISGLELGDTITGAFSAKHALWHEYGNSNTPGRFFVRSAVIGWQAAVDQAVALFAD